MKPRQTEYTWYGYKWYLDNFNLPYVMNVPNRSLVKSIQDIVDRHSDPAKERIVCFKQIGDVLHALSEERHIIDVFQICKSCRLLNYLGCHTPSCRPGTVMEVMKI